MDTDLEGNIYIADQENHIVRMISFDGSITTFAGINFPGYADGPSIIYRLPKMQRRLSTPLLICQLMRKVVLLSRTAEIMLSDTFSMAWFQRLQVLVSLALWMVKEMLQHLIPPLECLLLQVKCLWQTAQIIRYVGLTCVCAIFYRLQFDYFLCKVSTFVGTGNAGGANGAANETQLSQPMGLCMTNNSFIILDTGGHNLRTVDMNEQVSLFAGKYGVSGSAGGFRVDARFNSPYSCDTDSIGNIYIGNFLC